MTKKQKFWKSIIAVVVLGLLCIGTWATTSARLTSGGIFAPSTDNSATNDATKATNLVTSLTPPAGDSIFGVFELEGNILKARTLETTGPLSTAQTLIMQTSKPVFYLMALDQPFLRPAAPKMI